MHNHGCITNVLIQHRSLLDQVHGQAGHVKAWNIYRGFRGIKQFCVESTNTCFIIVHIVQHYLATKVTKKWSFISRAGAFQIFKAHQMHVYIIHCRQGMVLIHYYCMTFVLPPKAGNCWQKLGGKLCLFKINLMMVTWALAAAASSSILSQDHLHSSTSPFIATGKSKYD